MLIHLRVIPDFWTAVEERDRPELSPRPVIIGGLPEERGAVREANLAARYSGVQIGMTLSQAYQQCPEGIFLTPDLARYQAAWSEVCEVLQRYTPKFEPAEMGQAFLDLAGCRVSRNSDPWEDAAEIASQVQADTRINSWMGVASTRVTAQLASTQGGITVIEPGREQDFLADLPITLLPEVEPRTALTFQVLGLKTIGQLADLPASAVRQRFGPLGERLHNYARGIDSRAVVPPPAGASVALKRECEDGSLEEAVTMIHRLSGECVGELETAHLAGRLIGLTLIWEPDASNKPARASSNESVEAHCIRPATSPEMPVNCIHPAASSGDANDTALPVPYRIHSMLPQPKPSLAATLRPLPTPISSSIDVPIVSNLQNASLPTPKPTSSKFTTLARTSISNASQLFERVQKLLVQAWSSRPENYRLRAIELEVSQFERPAQLAFAELNRLDQTGRLAGLDPGRLQAIVQQEEALTARYGDDSFRHIASVNPAGILTERRFTWGNGIPWRKSS